MAEELLKFVEERGKEIKASRRSTIYKSLIDISEKLKKEGSLAGSVILYTAAEELQRTSYDNALRLLEDTLKNVNLNEPYKKDIAGIVDEVRELQRVRIGRGLAERVDEYLDNGAEILLKAKGVKAQIKDEIAKYVQAEIAKIPLLDLEKKIRPLIEAYIKSEVERLVGRGVLIHLERRSYEVEPLRPEKIEFMCNLVSYGGDIRSLSQTLGETKTKIKSSIEELEKLRLIRKEDNQIIILEDGFKEIERYIGTTFTELMLNLQTPRTKNQEELLLKLSILKKGSSGEYLPGPVLEAYERSKSRFREE
jgi:hypothetical protein